MAEWTAGHRLLAQFVDAVIAVTFAAAILLDKARAGELRGARHLLLGVGLTAALTMSLLVRRHFPLTTLIVGAAAVAAEPVLDVASTVSPYGGQILVYSAGLYAARRRSWWAPPVIVLGVVVYFAAASRSSPARPSSTRPSPGR